MSWGKAKLKSLNGEIMKEIRGSKKQQKPSQ